MVKLLWGGLSKFKLSEVFVFCWIVIENVTGLPSGVREDFRICYLFLLSNQSGKLDH